MYGTVARWRVREGMEQELEAVAKEIMAVRPPGSRSVTLYRSDSDPREYWVASVWDSREVYTANSSTPEQNERFQKLRTLIEADPEWHDGEVVVAQM